MQPMIIPDTMPYQYQSISAWDKDRKTRSYLKFRGADAVHATEDDEVFGESRIRAAEEISENVINAFRERESEWRHEIANRPGT